MIWYSNFFGHADQVGKFFGIPVAEASAEPGEDHAAAAEDSHADTSHEASADEGHGEGAEGEHHVVFAGEPGEGAIYFGPDNHVLEDAHASPAWVKVSPFIAMLIGFAVAYLFYIANPSLPGRLAARFQGLYRFLLNKWYFDELYDRIFVNPAKRIGYGLQ